MKGIILSNFFIFFINMTVTAKNYPSISLGEFTSELVMNKSGTIAYASKDTLSGKVLIINLKNLRVVKEIPVGKKPLKPIVDSTRNKLYIINRISKNLDILDLETYKIEKKINLGFICDAGYTISKDYLLIPHDRDGKVSVISLDKMKLHKVINLGFSIHGPLVLNPDGHTLYVRNNATETILVVDLGT